MNEEQLDKIPWSKFARKLYSNGTWFEFGLFFASILAYAVQVKSGSPIAVYTMISILSLLLLYYLIVGFRCLHDDANITEKIFVKVMGIALSVSISGFIAAKLYHFSAYYLLLGGVLLMILCAIVVAIIMMTKGSRYLNIISLARIIIIASLISGFVGSVGVEKLKNPELIETNDTIHKEIID
jgi:hypothetical protein